MGVNELIFNDNIINNELLRVEVGSDRRWVTYF